jgi:hypothetical protein
MLVVVALFLIVMIWLTPKIIRALRWLIARFSRNGVGYRPR